MRLGVVVMNRQLEAQDNEQVKEEVLIDTI